MVVFFYPKDDNKQHKLKDERSGDSKISFSYDVIKIWELKKSYIIEKKLIGLYSLLPLMQIEPGETDEEIIERSVSIIETIEDENIINRLFEKAIKTGSLDEFEELLEKVKKLN